MSRPEYLFATKEGRKEICQSASTQRLIFVILNANYPNYPATQEELHQELSPRVMEFAPKAYLSRPNQKVPFLTVNDQQREQVYTSRSEFSGDFFVYDVTTDENGKEVTLRQLIFSSNKNLIQSEAKLWLTKRKKKTVKLIDHSYLACLHHGAIICGICLYNHVYFGSLEQSLESGLRLSDNAEPRVLRILLVGLGGGCFTSFLQHNLKPIAGVKLEFDAVEIDPTMVEVARKWFDLNENLKQDQFEIRIVVEDGITYLDRFEKAGHYNMIIFDIDNKFSKGNDTGLSCPPPEFLEPKTLGNVKRLLKADALSLFMLNLAARNNSIKKSMEGKLKESFGQVNKYRIPDETNNIYYCFNQQVQLDDLLDKEKSLSERIQRFMALFTTTMKGDLSSVVDCCDFLTNLTRLS